MLARVFATEWDTLGRLRAQSPELDEICADYVLLTKERDVAQADTGPDADALLLQIDDSLSGLHQEILTYLARHASRVPDLSGTPPHDQHSTGAKDV